MQSQSLRYQSGLYDESFETSACGVGMIVNASRPARHEILRGGLEILKNLAHRSALGADGETSDGAGIMVQIPDAFFRNEISQLPPFGEYAVAQIFAPPNLDWLEALTAKAMESGMQVLHCREVPVDSSVLGPQAKSIEPKISQVFISRTSKQELMNLRTWAEEKFRKLSGCRDLDSGESLSQFFVCSLSTQHIVYKGLMQPKNLASYFVDLKSPLFATQFAMVHSRFSTNTLPAWELAQPFRMSCHNGEINTIHANRQWMRAPGHKLIEGRSDSASFDEALEKLILGGRSMLTSVAMMIPEPINESLKKEARDFFEFQEARMEAWDGPAAICFVDQDYIGACLDRNGLRPFRYQVLRDNTLIAGSEAGILRIEQNLILQKGQLKPGQFLTVDFKTGHIDLKNENKKKLFQTTNFAKWNQQEQLNVKALENRFSVRAALCMAEEPVEFWSRAKSFGFHYDEILEVLMPMYREKEEVLSSMGYDTPLAILSERPQLLTQYFKQLFAQVTNPPIDPIREKAVMSLTTYLGPRASLLDLESDNKKRWRLESPILFYREMNLIREWSKTKSFYRETSLRTGLIDSTFNLCEKTFEARVAEICEEAEGLTLRGCEVLILSDRSPEQGRAPIPALLIASAVHQHLIEKGLRLAVSLIGETGEARDSHQIACLISFGCDAVAPYMVEQLAYELEHDHLKDLSAREALAHYRKAIDKSLLKIMSKLGISTLRSYCGAQAFEALGLSNKLVTQYFLGTTARLGGLTAETLTEEVRRRWVLSGARPANLADLNSSGDYHYRPDGEQHHWNPSSITALQISTRNRDFESFKKFSEEMSLADRFSLRGQLRFRKSSSALPICEVEPAHEIVKRFTTGAMSLGALSSEAHESLAVAMNRLGAKSNSGEGGEDSARFKTEKNSEIKQIASGRFGVTAEYLVNARELQIKMAQGAKPGEGGQLSGHKVDREIARIRNSTPGVTLISPPPHHDIYSIEDLAQLIFDLKTVNPVARISVKLVAKAGVGTIAAGVAKARAEKILISGDGGGTGAAALSSIRHAGIPWEIGLAETHQTLQLNALRSQVRLEADGQLRTGRDVAIAAILGADEFGFSTAPLVSQGCLMMRKCHLNTCPVGIATQDPILRTKFKGEPEQLIQYFFFVAEELRGIMAELGVRTVAELTGRVDLLESAPNLSHWKAKDLDLSALLHPTPRREVKRVKETIPYVLGPGDRAIRNTDRSVGAAFSGQMARGEACVKHIEFSLMGSAGQSLGAFLVRGIRLKVLGEANDYVGKALSGGRIVVAPHPDFLNHQNSSIVGNTCLYGATSGELFVAGRAGERFGVRNSGATAVVEGLGNHGCEYMTGGRIVVLGSVGQNFAAGMSGGLAFVLDEARNFRTRCNLDMVDIESLTDREDETWLRETLLAHYLETQSIKAKVILDSWQFGKNRFLKVIPKEYRRVLIEAKKEMAL